jgi:copper chaperone CopZ
VTVQAAYSVEGMTCGHCVHAVVTELSAVAGVTDVRVTLVPGSTSRVDLYSREPIAPALVVAAIDAAGYTVASP